MNLEDRHTGFGTRHRDLDDAVEPSRSQERFVEDVRTIRRPDDLDLSQRVEAIEFREELHQRPLDLPVSGRRDLEALGADRIESVDEDDGRRLLPGELEQFPHQASAFADVFLHELGADEPDERRLRAVRDRLREERLAGPWRSDEEAARRGLDPDLPIQVRLQERILHSLPEFSHLDFQAADVPVGDRGLLDNLGAGDDRVEGGRQDTHHGEGLLVQRDARADDEVVLRDVVRRVHDEVRTRRRLDDDAAVGQDVTNVADDQRRALETIQFLFQPSDLLLESDELRFGVPLLAFHPAGGLQQLVVAVLERGDAHGHFLGEFADLIVVHRFARWVGYERRLYTRHFLFSLCGPGS